MKFSEKALIEGEKLHKKLQEAEERLRQVLPPIPAGPIDDAIEDGVREMRKKLELDRPESGEIC